MDAVVSNSIGSAFFFLPICEIIRPNGNGKKFTLMNGEPKFIVRLRLTYIRKCSTNFSLRRLMCPHLHNV